MGEKSYEIKHGCHEMAAMMLMMINTTAFYSLYTLPVFFCMDSYNIGYQLTASSVAVRYVGIVVDPR